MLDELKNSTAKQQSGWVSERVHRWMDGWMVLWWHNEECQATSKIPQRIFSHWRTFTNQHHRLHCLMAKILLFSHYFLQPKKGETKRKLKMHNMTLMGTSFLRQLKSKERTQTLHNNKTNTLSKTLQCNSTNGNCSQKSDQGLFFQNYLFCVFLLFYFSLPTKNRKKNRPHTKRSHFKIPSDDTLTLNVVKS